MRAPLQQAPADGLAARGFALYFLREARVNGRGES